MGYLSLTLAITSIPGYREISVIRAFLVYHPSCVKAVKSGTIPCTTYRTVVREIREVITICVDLVVVFI